MELTKEIKERLNEIEETCGYENWDGYMADPVPPTVVDNCTKFIQSILDLGIDIDEEDIVPCTSGCIDVDLTLEETIISFYIEESSMGWFITPSEPENFMGLEKDIEDFSKLPDQVEIWLINKISQQQ